MRSLVQQHGSRDWLKAQALRKASAACLHAPPGKRHFAGRASPLAIHPVITPCYSSPPVVQAKERRRRAAMELYKRRDPKVGGEEEKESGKPRPNPTCYSNSSSSSNTNSDGG